MIEVSLIDAEMTMRRVLADPGRIGRLAEQVRCEIGRRHGMFGKCCKPEETLIKLLYGLADVAKNRPDRLIDLLR